MTGSEPPREMLTATLKPPIAPAKHRVDGLEEVPRRRRLNAAGFVPQRSRPAVDDDHGLRHRPWKSRTAPGRVLGAKPFKVVRPSTLEHGERLRPRPSSVGVQDERFEHA